jgi:hypothetical protein
LLSRDDDDDTITFFGDFTLILIFIPESKQFEDEDDDVEDNPKSPGQWLTGGSSW